MAGTYHAAGEPPALHMAGYRSGRGKQPDTFVQLSLEISDINL
jgi:hypothetical protein